MKPPALFAIALLLAVGVLAYTSFVPGDSHALHLVRVGPETARLQRGEALRNILFAATLGMALLALVLAFWKPRAAAALWCVTLVVVTIRAFLPSFPVQLFPFAAIVFWTGLFVQGILCYSTFRALRRQPSSVPNGTDTAL